MRLLITLASLLHVSSIVFGQHIQLIQQGVSSDSSYYCVTQIDDNRFWAGGEYGIFNSIDSLGNVTAVDYPGAGVAILNIEKVRDNVYVTTEDAVIYRYSISQDSFYTRRFEQFKNRCFYDIAVLQDGRLLVCGGSSHIAKGRKRVPKGFIAIIDQDLQDVEVVWKSTRKFVWSILEAEDDGILAVTFNGINTQVMKSLDGTSWKKEMMVKGLVHDLAYIDQEVWYCGSRKIDYNKKGIVGQVSTKRKHEGPHDRGCLWSVHSCAGNLVAVTQHGELMMIDKVTDHMKYVPVPGAYTLYDMAAVSPSKVLVVGHGKTAYFLDFGH